MATPKQTDPQFKLRLPFAVKDKIDRAAESNNRSMNAEIVARLEASFENDAVMGEQNEAVMDLVEKLVNMIGAVERSQRTVDRLLSYIRDSGGEPLVALYFERPDDDDAEDKKK